MLPPLEFFGDGERGDDRAAVAEREHRVEDDGVRFAPEVRRFQARVEDATGDRAGQHDRAEHGSLGVEVVRRHAVEGAHDADHPVGA